MLLTVKLITSVREAKRNESTTKIFVYLFYTKSITKYYSFYWQFWLVWLIITLNYQELPGKQHDNNVCLSVLYKHITNNRLLCYLILLVTPNFPKWSPNYNIPNARLIFAYPFNIKISVKMGVSIENLQLWDLISLKYANYPVITS